MFVPRGRGGRHSDTAGCLLGEPLRSKPFCLGAFRLALGLLFAHGLGALHGAFFCQSLLSRGVKGRLGFIGYDALGHTLNLPSPGRRHLL
jgi:hypothetical protein